MVSARVIVFGKMFVLTMPECQRPRTKSSGFEEPKADLNGHKLEVGTQRAP